nr:MAG TPA: hypothetical protein [Caudoviricetes sp.]
MKPTVAFGAFSKLTQFRTISRTPTTTTRNWTIQTFIINPSIDCHFFQFFAQKGII